MLIKQSYEWGRSLSRSWHLTGNLIPAIAVIALSAILIQWHSIVFWQSFTGEIGIVWSISLELISLWLWFNKHHLLAAITSLLLICGPIYELGQPVAGKTRAEKELAIRHQQQVELLEKQIQQLEETQRAYLANSRDRVGWAKRIDETQSALDKLRAKQLKAIQDRTAISPASETAFIFSIQIVSLSAILLSQILAIRKVRNISTQERKETPRNSQDENSLSKALPQCSVDVDSEPEAHIDCLIEQIQQALSYEMKSKSISQAEWARRHGVSEKSLSLIKNHQRRQANGQETVSKRVVLDLVHQLQPETDSSLQGLSVARVGS